MIKLCATEDYYAGNGLWTPRFEDAKTFEDLSLAFWTARHDGLTDCCVVVFRPGWHTFEAQFPI